MSRALYEKKTEGSDSEFSFLESKRKSIEHLNVSLPGLCLSFSYHYGEAGNRQEAVEWLRRAVNAGYLQ
jgi:hypothetical protein